MPLCERHRKAIIDGVNDEDKLEALEAMQRHVQLAKTGCYQSINKSKTKTRRLLSKIDKYS